MPRLPHIFLTTPPDDIPYTSTAKGGSTPKFKPRDPQRHARHIRRLLNEAWETARQNRIQRTAVSIPTRNGTCLEFQSAPGFGLQLKSLEQRKQGIRLLNVQTYTPHLEAEPIIQATVYIPPGKEKIFLGKVNQYQNEVTNKGKPKNAPLIEGIENIRLALLESFWQDSPDLMPEKQAQWCEVWLMYQGDDQHTKVEAEFRVEAEAQGVAVGDGSLIFPERLVLLVFADLNQLSELIEVSDHIAEFRRAKETASFWLDQENKDQVEWIEDLQERLEIDEDSQVAICVLDTGANNGHPLLAPLLADEDRHSVNTDGVDDHHREGHGTMMCGLAGYGDLQRVLEDFDRVSVRHRLESVKILPKRGRNPKKLHGVLTARAIALAATEAPERRRIICMAVTAEDTRDEGRPTSWSAELDSLASGDDDTEKRLIIVSAGNVDGWDEWSRYPDSNITNSVHDPGQSWNALTIGAYTTKTRITDPDMTEYKAIAPAGGLSPFSSSSLTWLRDGNKWPVKPEVVFEGGNIASGPDGFCTAHKDLSLLTTSHEHTKRQFSWFNATSAAAAQAAHMAAQIQAEYPDAWPETVRALMVHSAEWPPALKKQFQNGGGKTNYARMIRICGYGVPNLRRALHCASNSLTLVMERELQPFDRKEKNSGFCTKDMHLYELPWPKEVLMDLAETHITMRVTLSYFIEPGPMQVGWKDRYRYASHALRFNLINVGEDKERFVKRINFKARDEEYQPETTSGSHRWTIGSEGRNAGSIHSDIWTGPAVDIATCHTIAVSPVIGWWRERSWLNRWNRKTRYSLIVSLHTPDESVDIYTPVAIQIGVPVGVEI